MENLKSRWGDKGAQAAVHLITSLNSCQYNIQSLKVIYKLIVWHNFFLFDHFTEIDLNRRAAGDQVW